MDAAVALFHNVFADGQPQTSTTGFGGEVGLEKFVQVFFADAGTVVFNFDAVASFFGDE